MRRLFAVRCCRLVPLPAPVPPVALRVRCAPLSAWPVARCFLAPLGTSDLRACALDLRELPAEAALALARRAALVISRAKQFVDLVTQWGATANGPPPPEAAVWSPSLADRYAV